MPQYDKTGKIIQPTYSMGGSSNPTPLGGATTNVPNSTMQTMGGASAGGGMASGDLASIGRNYAGLVGYSPGMQSPTLPSNSQAAVTQAQAAVQGLIGAGQPGEGSPNTAGGGGEGSSYSIGPDGKVTSTVTPNLLPQQAQLQQAQTQLEGQIAADAAKAGFGYNSTLSAQGSAQNQTEAAQREGLGEKAFQSQWDLLQPYLNGTANGSTLTSPRVTMGGAMSPEEQAARAAAFGRAKDQAGQTAIAGLQSLQGELAARGLNGAQSTIETQGLGNVIGGAAGGVQNFTREQLINDLNRYAGIADETYQGDITQRGQDLQARQATLAPLLGLLGRGITY